MSQPKKQNWDKDYGEIWAEFRDNPHYRGLHETELRQIHLKWKRLGIQYGSSR